MGRGPEADRKERYLIDNIRKMERIAAGVQETLDLQAVPIGRVLNAIEDMFSERFAAKEIHFQKLIEVDTDTEIWADENILVYNIVLQPFNQQH